MPKKKSAIPDGWTDYRAVGKRIPGTRFIAFKVPLKQSLRDRVAPSEAFGPNDLLHVLEEEHQQLGLIIDLTFTTRYYRPEDLPESVYYIKIFTAGHEVPSDPTILSFKKAVRRFLRDNEDNDNLIGVHCTHGLNRTGYLVCRYLIDVEGIEPEKAIELFNASRGHTIERENYIDDLQKGPKRSNYGIEEPEQEPIQGGTRQRPPNTPFNQIQARHPPPFWNQGAWPRHHRFPDEDGYGNEGFEEPEQEPVHRGTRQRPPNTPFNQTQARHPPPFRNQTALPRHHRFPDEDYGPPPGWMTDQRPSPPSFVPGPGLLPDPPAFMRFPNRPRTSEWGRRAPRYNFDEPPEDLPDQQHLRGPHWKSRGWGRDRDHPRPPKHIRRGRRT